MAKKTPKLKDIVPDPKYGDKPRSSGLRVSEDEVRASYWGYQNATIFPESAIKADVKKQNYSIFPRGFYVDILGECRNCDRKFIFFAQEQRHWYEDLHFYIDSNCVLCPECRKADKSIKTSFKRYSENVVSNELTDELLAILVEDAMFLWEKGVIKNHHVLRGLLKRADKQIPENPVTRNIKLLVESLLSDGAA